MEYKTKAKLDHLAETKGLIRAAIEAKGQTVEDFDTFRSYAEKIEDIDQGPTVLDEITITPDFTNGDFKVSAEDGYAVKSATVKKPDNLVPEYILNGIEIAGIIGSAAGGGGGSGGGDTGYVSFYRYFTPTSGLDYTLTHGLGVTPDLVFVYGLSKTNDRTVVWVGASRAFYTACGNKFPLNLSLGVYNNAIERSNWQVAIDESPTSRLPISANSETVTIRSPYTNSMLIDTGSAHYAYIIAGLT